mmetsp:Transcript_158396/g.504044  ORF Transcript_158396/g.504044 Transcript_158396/m.504044 type:complete len:462 (+) Transcript_158396:298-1683(+)
MHGRGRHRRRRGLCRCRRRPCRRRGRLGSEALVGRRSPRRRRRGRRGQRRRRGRHCLDARIRHGRRTALRAAGAAERGEATAATRAPCAARLRARRLTSAARAKVGAALHLKATSACDLNRRLAPAFHAEVSAGRQLHATSAENLAASSLTPVGGGVLAVFRRPDRARCLPLVPVRLFGRRHREYPAAARVEGAYGHQCTQQNGGDHEDTSGRIFHPSQAASPIPRILAEEARSGAAAEAAARRAGTTDAGLAAGRAPALADAEEAAQREAVGGVGGVGAVGRGAVGGHGQVAVVVLAQATQYRSKSYTDEASEPQSEGGQTEHQRGSPQERGCWHSSAPPLPHDVGASAQRPQNQQSTADDGGRGQRHQGAVGTVRVQGVYGDTDGTTARARRPQAKKVAAQSHQERAPGQRRHNGPAMRSPPAPHVQRQAAPPGHPRPDAPAHGGALAEGGAESTATAP